MFGIVQASDRKVNNGDVCFLDINFQSSQKININNKNLKNEQIGRD